MRNAGPGWERRAVDTLVGFGRLVAGSAATAEILAALARAAVGGVGVDAAAAFEVRPDGASRVAGSAGLPEGCGGFAADVDLVGAEIGEALRAALGGAFAASQTVPLASGGRVFGSLVLLHRGAAGLGPEAVEILGGLVDLAAAGLAGAAQYAELAESYAELRRSRVALQRGEKLRALGQMAAGVAHDLKNILTPLSLHLQVLRRCVPADNAMAMESISEMRTAVSRGVETTERLRAFSHQSPSDHRVAADLDALAREAMRIASARARAGVRYELVDALGAAPPVRVTPGECVSALVNLIVNAIDAMPGGGTIEVSSGASEGGSWLRVVDDGPGMTPEVEQRVFEPFFTTKGDEGTGLGLATLYSFVQQSRGRVELRTAPGRGAAFTLWFPSADGPSSRPPRG